MSWDMRTQDTDADELVALEHGDGMAALEVVARIQDDCRTLQQLLRSSLTQDAEAASYLRRILGELERGREVRVRPDDFRAVIRRLTGDGTR